MNVGIPSSKMSLAIIVSHCFKSLDWIPRITRDMYLCRNINTTIYIYEKCKYLQHASWIQTEKINTTGIPCNWKYIELPNVGREGHTWIYHILNNKFNYADFNVFVQGGMEMQITVLKKSIIAAANEYNQVWSNSPHVTFWEHFNSGQCTPFNQHIFPKHKWKKLFCDWFVKFNKRKKKVEDCNKSRISYKGEMAANKAAMQKVLSQQRFNLRNMFQALKVDKNPKEGYVLERLWLNIFAGYQTCGDVGTRKFRGGGTRRQK